MAFPALAKNGTQVNADNADKADLTGFMRSTYSVSENQRPRWLFFVKSDTLLFVKSRYFQISYPATSDYGSGVISREMLEKYVTPMVVPKAYPGEVMSEEERWTQE